MPRKKNLQNEPEISAEERAQLDTAIEEAEETLPPPAAKEEAMEEAEQGADLPIQEVTPENAETEDKAPKEEALPWPEPDFTKIERRRVMHRYDNHDRDEINAKIVACLDKKKEVAAERSEINARLKEIDDDIDQLMKSRDEQGEWRALECEVRFHWSRGKKQIIHPETGIVIEELDITQEDRERPLPGMEDLLAQGNTAEADTSEKEEEDTDPKEETLDSADLDEGDANDEIPSEEVC